MSNVASDNRIETSSNKQDTKTGSQLHYKQYATIGLVANRPTTSKIKILR